MKKTLATFILIATCLLSSVAQAPAGYYNSLVGKKEGDLKTAACQLVRNFTQVSSYTALPSYFRRTDVYPQSNRWWDMYSNIPLYAPSFSGLNREHSFPKSWWGGLTDVPAYVDLNHLYPSEAEANMAKNNYPLGEVATSVAPSFQNGVVKVGHPATGIGGGSQTVFEPADEYKGDFARTYFYMVTTYQNLTWTTKYAWMMTQELYPTLKGWAIDLLLKWHRQDPVSEKEVNRNEVVYSIQNNRNPFIDCPELAEYIWGSKKGQPFELSSSGTEPVGDPVLITPVQDMTLDFGEVALGNSITAKLLFRGENLRNAVQIAISRRSQNPDMFSLPSSAIRADLVNAPDGYWLNVTYTPTALGEHSSRLIISDYDNTGASRGVELKGSCSPVPVLTPCTALPATDVTSDSYTANWTSPEGEVVDYWVVNVTRTTATGFVTEQVLAEAPGVTIEGFNESERDTYTVQSVRLGYMSAVSNVIFVDHSGINGIESDQMFSVQGFDGIMRFNCNGAVSGVNVYDISGQLILTLNNITDNTDIPVAPGIYLVSAPGNAPQKVIVY